MAVCKKPTLKTSKTHGKCICNASELCMPLPQIITLSSAYAHGMAYPLSGLSYPQWCRYAAGSNRSTGLHPMQEIAESIARVEAAAEAVRQELQRSSGRAVRATLSVAGAPDRAGGQIRLAVEVDAYEEIMSGALQVR